jgi:uncharacterized protein YgiM (DUF1202 family)
MVTLLRVVSIVALCATGAAAAETLFPLVVAGDRVCLRARADGGSEVVWQVSSGTVLQGTGRGSNWVEVLAPGEASVWLATNLVINGIVQVPKAQVRAGPGMNYPVVGSAQKDDRIEVRGEAYGWVKIGPTASCRLWISRSYVKPAPEQKGTVRDRAVSPAVHIVAAPSRPGVSVPVVPVAVGAPGASDAASAVVSSNATAAPAPPLSSAVQQAALSAVATQMVAKAATGVFERDVARTPPVLPEALKKYEMDSDGDQGRQALYRGTMERCNWLLRKPAEYRLLARHPRRGIVTLCYVSGDPVLLAAQDGKQVTVSGREYRLKGVERPVVVYESVVEDAVDSTRAGIVPAVP